MAAALSSRGLETTAPPAAAPAARPSRLRALAEITVMIALVAGAFNAVLIEVRAPTTAMRPSVREGERVLADRLTFALAQPRRGDIALVAEPAAQGSVLARRVIGLPGERVIIRGRQVVVDDRVLDEPYLDLPDSGEPLNFTQEIRLRDGEYFLLSDNREAQAGFNDSRTWGAVPARRLLGRALLVYWPIEAIRLIETPVYADGEP